MTAAADRLLEAAAEYIESIGGKPVVLSLGKIQQWPGDHKYNWELVIRVTGKKPTKIARGR